jgi:hypothetical protein
LKAFDQAPSDLELWNSSNLKSWPYQGDGVTIAPTNDYLDINQSYQAHNAYKCIYFSG